MLSLHILNDSNILSELAQSTGLKLEREPSQDSPPGLNVALTLTNPYRAQLWDIILVIAVDRQYV